MTVVIEDKGIAFMAGEQEALDGGAMMTLVSAIEILERDHLLVRGRQYSCPVRFEDKDGNLIRRIKPSKVQALVGFLNKGREKLYDHKTVKWDEADPIVKLATGPGMVSFMADAIPWLMTCVERRWPVFVDEVELGRIAVKPEWNTGIDTISLTESSVEQTD